MATQQELDDLDDLDDILDDFDSTSANPSVSAPVQRPLGPNPPPNTSTSSFAPPDPDFTDDDFARQLQQGMEQLMREMETSPTARSEFESLVKSMSDATASASTANKTSFSDTISRTMERMQESESAADKARDEAELQSETDAFLAEMLKQLDSAGGGDGAGGEAGMANLLEGMMEQLMSKDILYEPMKDLQEKYPPWLASNKEKLSTKEYETYTTQYSYVTQIMTKFDDPRYDDEDKKAKADLVDLMQKMQELGPPPKEIMSELAPGMELDADGLPSAPGGDQCSLM